jgi:sec-independent protein translocase protein TatB
MFDIGWSELMVIGVVALVVVGPKDLPRLMKEVGKFTSQARGMARQFRAGWDTMMHEAEIEELRRTTQEAVNSINPLKDVSNPLDEMRGAVDDLTRDPFDAVDPKPLPAPDKGTAT